MADPPDSHGLGWGAIRVEVASRVPPYRFEFTGVFDGKILTEASMLSIDGGMHTIASNRSPLAVPLLLVAAGCASSPAANGEGDPRAPVSPTAAAEAPAAEVPVETAEASSAAPAEAQEATAPTESAAAPPPGDPARAAELLDEGRALQREKGEGGAEAAIAKYQEAIAADAQCAACYWELGWSHQLLNQFEENIAAWDEVRRLDPDFEGLDVHYPVAEMRRDQARALAALPETGALPEPELEPRAGPTVRFRAVGDVQMGRAWPAHRAVLPPDDAMDLFEHLRDELRDADITFGNLETALNDDADSTKCGPKSTKCFAFRAPTSYSRALADAGFDVMSIANNHAGDFGQKGRETTMKALDEAGIAHSGPVGDIAHLEHNGLRIALIAFHTGGGVHRVQETETAKKLVAKEDQSHDLVIVSFHGGAEGARADRVPHGTEKFLGEDRGNLREFSHAVVDAGADLVIGHGPHRLRGMEIYKGRLIAYSLGNFSCWKTFSLEGPLGITGILEVTLAANGVATEAKLLPGTILDPGRPAPDPKKRAIDIVRDLSRKDFNGPLLDEKGVWKRSEATARK